MSFFPLLVGTDMHATWGRSFELAWDRNGPGKGFSKLLILCLADWGVHEKSMISGGTDICSLIPKLQQSWHICPATGAQGTHWGHTSSLLFCFGNKIGYLKARSPGSIAWSFMIGFCSPLPAAVRSLLSPSLAYQMHVSDLLLCSWPCLQGWPWERASFPLVECSSKWWIRGETHHAINICLEGDQCLIKLTWELSVIYSNAGIQ